MYKDAWHAQSSKISTLDMSKVNKMTVKKFWLAQSKQND